jgi:hypothetical protein
VGVYRDGLIARIGAQDMPAATAQPGMRPFDMTGRPMRGIVVIQSAALNGKALDRRIRQARSSHPDTRPECGKVVVFDTGRS